MRSKRSTLEATRRFSVVAILPGDEAADTANFGKIFVANRICTVLKISASHVDLSTVAGTLDVERLQGTEPSDGGDPLLAGTKILLNNPNDTIQSPDLTGTTDHLILAAGDRLNLKDGGAGVTNLEGLCITVDLQEEVAAAVVRSKVAMYDTRRILLPIHLPGAIAGTALNYGVVFIAPADSRYKFVGAEVVYTAKAGAAAATVTVEKLTAGTPGQAPDAGVELLDAAFDMTGDAEVVQYGTIATVSDINRTLADGDRLCLKDVGAGNLANLRNVEVTIELEELVTVRAKQAPTEKERIFVTAVLYGLQPQTAAMHDKFFTASKPCKVVAARYVHTTKSGDALEFIQIEKLTGIEVPSNGAHILTNNTDKGFNGDGVNETVEEGVIVATGAEILAIGDRLALDPVDGNLGALAGVCVTVELEAIQ
ncbi:hypothetical protein ES703_90815 [subsurface metagenome]